METVFNNALKDTTKIFRQFDVSNVLQHARLVTKVDYALAVMKEHISVKTFAKNAKFPARIASIDQTNALIVYKTTGSTPIIIVVI